MRQIETSLTGSHQAVRTLGAYLMCFRSTCDMNPSSSMWLPAVQIICYCLYPGAGPHVISYYFKAVLRVYFVCKSLDNNCHCHNNTSFQNPSLSLLF